MIFNSRQFFERDIGVRRDRSVCGDERHPRAEDICEMQDRRGPRAIIRKIPRREQVMHDVGLLLELMDKAVFEQRFDLEARDHPDRSDNDDGEDEVCERNFCLDAFHRHALKR